MKGAKNIFILMKLCEKLLVYQCVQNAIEDLYGIRLRKWKRRIKKTEIPGSLKLYGDNQGPNFDDMSSFFPCEIDEAIQYINLGYGAHAPKICYKEGNSATPTRWLF